LEANLYANTIGLAASEIQGNNPGRAMELLASCAEPLRGWEWRHLRGLRFREPLVPRGAHGYFYDPAFSPARRPNASAGATDQTARIWDAITGEELLKLPGSVYSVAFHPDGRRLLAAGNRSLTLWETTTGRELRTFLGHGSALNCVRFSPDGSRAFSAA